MRLKGYDYSQHVHGIIVLHETAGASLAGYCGTEERLG